MWDRISELWCKSMHSKAMWPMHGKYTCPDCLREYPVIWEDSSELTKAGPRVNRSFEWSAKTPVHQLVLMLKRFGTM
jgi:hypothetical protein